MAGYKHVNTSLHCVYCQKMKTNIFIKKDYLLLSWLSVQHNGNLVYIVVINSYFSKSLIFSQIFLLASCSKGTTFCKTLPMRSVKRQRHLISMVPNNLSKTKLMLETMYVPSLPNRTKGPQDTVFVPRNVPFER